ncbi:transcriptional regulator [Streptomyces echinoruber]|uniref:Transcriptional regulator n=1 Tax=Streptomyces echinoruber TaxID=68898 RepID=A0A918VPA7_9ACTN|nr:transcriptional regulator [Streptomyces echinoruber]
MNRRRLRLELRRAREAAGQTQTEAAQALEWSLSKIMRIEAGTVSVSVTDVRALIQQYGVTDPKLVAELEEAARGSKGPSWWAPWSDIMTPGFKSYIGYESAAASIRTYHPVIMPGLLQTEDYAAAVLKPLTDDARARRIIELRTARQERTLEGDAPPPWLFFVVDEAALYRQVGGPQVQRNQLQHLVNMAQRPRVSLQVLPLTAGAHYATQTSFVLLGFHDDEDLLYMEHRGDATVRDDFELIVRYQECFEWLRETAYDTEHSIDLITRVREGIDTT